METEASRTALMLFRIVDSGLLLKENRRHMVEVENKGRHMEDELNQ